LAAYYAEAIQTMQPQGPYYLGGWSMGGVVAFEMAQQLQRRGENVARLVVFDSQALGHAAVPEWVEQALMMLTLTDNLEKIFGKKLKIPMEQLRSLAFGEQVGYVLNLAREAEMPSPDEAPQIRQLLELFRTNQQASRRYQPQPYSGSLTLFTAAERIVPGSRDPSLGWANLVGGNLDIHQVSGTHFTMLQEPYVEVLAKQLKTCLNQT
jgi:thioesterase domain-containing protein